LKKIITYANILALIGLVAGYLYWHEYACTEGCAITSKWYGSMIAGGLIGHLIGGMIEDFISK